MESDSTLYIFHPAVSL